MNIFLLFLSVLESLMALSVVSAFSIEHLLKNRLVNVEGRMEYESGRLRGDWPATGIRFAFKSFASQFSTLSISFSQCNCKYFVQPIVDGLFWSPYEISSVSNFTLKFSIDNSSSIHEVVILKKTEASCGDSYGIMAIESIDVYNGDFIRPQTMRKQRFLFVGDSITAAYGVDGISPCTFSASTENVFHGYASLISSHFNASMSTIAWSGKGVVRNYGDSYRTSEHPMPFYYNKTLGNDISTYWNPRKFPADVVFVMLGTNDYSTDPIPYDSDFIHGLTTLIMNIRSDYPSAVIFVACASLQRGPQCSNIQRSANITGTNYIYFDPSLNNGGYGCDGHPNYASHQNIANVAIRFMEPLLVRQH